MSVWLVRAGSRGEQEEVALSNNVATIGWEELPDLSKIKTKEELQELYTKTYPTAKKMEVANYVGQVWRFLHEIQKGDLVALPLKTQSAVAIGEVIGDYEYKEIASNVKHIRRLKWIKTFPRSSFDQDILYSLGAFMTVCKIERNDAENRIKKMLEGKILQQEVVGSKRHEEEIDIEEYAKDQIIKFLNANYKGHDLARLVTAILNAQGYVTTMSSPGPDGGVDILASSGPLGFDNPRICVQVKSSSSAIDVSVLRELQGVMQKVRANQGLLVSWGGFTQKALQEARDSFFTIRLRDQGTLLEEIFKCYDKFDDELKAELPLKRIWALVKEGE
ncbi:MAG: restriction endonuclease [Caldisericaceae bacterium]